MNEIQARRLVLKDNVAFCFMVKTWKTTADIKVPKLIVEQVIGQEKSVELIKKAAKQKRNILLVGLPGTGKSLLAQAMAEILPVSELKDILVYENQIDPNNPKIKVVKAGEGKKIMEKERFDFKKAGDNARLMGFVMPFLWFIFAYVIWQFGYISDIIFAALLLLGGFLMVGFIIGTQVRPMSGYSPPKLLIENSERKKAPFFDATGARAGALLGDVRHDPLQSGGLGTPPHLRVEPGMIHKASGGVLFIDEIATLSPKSQQELLTAMQDKKYSITGQSDMSSGAMTRTEPVSCDFVLVAAGNYEDLKKVHPALRSRIRGYGYEIYMKSEMEDNEENRKAIARFVAQEVVKDGKIPHFTKEAVEEIVLEARKRSGRKNKLTIKLRELGGLVRAAGDIAKEKGKKFADVEDLDEAKKSVKTLEQQMIEKALDYKKDYEIYKTEGKFIGRVNGLAVVGNSGTILPIEAEVVPASSKSEGKIIATGKLGEIAKEAVMNVSAQIKKLSGKDVSGHDVHIQFLQTYEGVEGDSASVSIATAVFSAMTKLPIRQNIVMTGSLSVRGDVLPVGGITPKLLAAIKAGYKEAIIPKANMQDIVLGKKDMDKIKIKSVEKLEDVLKIAIKSEKIKGYLRKINGN